MIAPKPQATGKLCEPKIEMFTMHRYSDLSPTLVCEYLFKQITLYEYFKQVITIDLREDALEHQTIQNHARRYAGVIIVLRPFL